MRWTTCLILPIFAILSLAFGVSDLAWAKKKESNTIKTAEIIRSAPPSRQLLDQQTMLLLGEAIPSDHAIHWETQQFSDGSETQVLIATAPYRGKTERGNMLVLAEPGTYPYQPRWYQQLQESLNQQGWNFLSLGIQAKPQVQRAPTRTELQVKPEQKPADLAQAYRDAFDQVFNTWAEDAKTRVLLLTSFSKSKSNAGAEFMLAIGNSAYIAGLIAKDSQLKLSGLILIDFETPKNEAGKKLDETLSAQGPILEIVFSPLQSVQRSALKRQKMAIKSGNNDYRVQFAPAGLQLHPAAMPWLSRVIHGWAQTSLKSKES